MSTGVKIFYVGIALVMGVIGYKGLTTQQVQAGDGKVVLSCVEFNSQAEADQFQRTGLVPAGSLVSNKNADECKGVRIAAK